MHDSRSPFGLLCVPCLFVIVYKVCLCTACLVYEYTINLVHVSTGRFCYICTLSEWNEHGPEPQTTDRIRDCTDTATDNT